MRIETMILTPQIAEQWLKTVDKDKQRAFRKHHAVAIAAAIKRGEWQMNNDMFMHGPHGLGNGQHRTASCVIAGVPIPIVVAWDCTEAEILAADQGRLTRNNADALRYEGFRNTNNLAAIINTLHKDINRKRFAPTHNEAIMFARLHQTELERSAKYWHRACDSHCPVPPSIICAVHFAARSAGHNAAESFADAVADMIPKQRGDAVWLLLKRFKEDRENRHNHMSRQLKVALTIIAYNHWRDDKKPKILRWSPGAKQPFPEIK